MSGFRYPSRLPSIVVTCVSLLVTSGSSAQERGALFPEPFVVEHGVVQTDPDGSVFSTEPVTDYYAGSRVISVRADGSRLVLDFARREITEIKPDRGTYAVLGFDRMAELQRRLHALENPSAQLPGHEKAGIPESRTKSVLRVVEVPVSEHAAAKSGTPNSPLLRGPDVKHLRVLRGGRDGAADDAVLDAWFDRGFRLGRRAMDTLEEFEIEVLGATANGSAADVPRAVAAARRESGGAVAIHTVRPLKSGPENTGGTIEDIVHRIETIQVVPEDLIMVPEGFRRNPHPLELIVAHAESEAELRARMGGAASGQ